MHIRIAVACAWVLAACTTPKPNVSDAGDHQPSDAAATDSGPSDGGVDAGGCPAGTDECDGDLSTVCETDLATDAAHCGSCDEVCGALDSCVEGSCVPPSVEQLALGDDFTCALLGTGQVVCWGRDHRGQLGDGHTTSDDSEDRPDPQPVVGLRDCVSVVAANGAACAICGDERTAYCWGLNNPSRFGPLGAYGETPTPEAVIFGATAAPIEEVDQDTHLCARTADAVYCAGRNTDGQLGWGDASTSTVALGAVEGLPAFTPLSVAVGTHFGNGFTLVAMSNHLVYCFGSDYDSECGGLPVDGGLATPTEVAGLSNVVQVTAGDRFGCALTLSGDVYCWGANDSGQIGNGTSGDPVQTPAQVMGLTSPIGRIMANGSTVLAVSADGHDVFGWGNNNLMMLGRGALAPDLYDSAVVVMSDPDATLDAAASASHACILRRRTGQTDQILCAGSNQYYQLGATTVADTSHFNVVPDFP